MAKKLPDELRYIDFNEKTRSAEITLEQLDHTVMLEDTRGSLSTVAPIEHSNLIKQVIEIAHKHTTKQVIEQKLTIKEGNVRRIQHRGSEPCPIEKYLVERLVTKISFNDPIFAGVEDAEGSMAVGISYTEKGIQMAFGHNVSVCQNLNIWGSYMWSTYGGNKQKVPFDKGMDLLVKWMKEYDEAKYYNMDRVEQLRAIEVDEAGRLRIIGRLFERAVRANNGDKSVSAPLNQLECGRMVSAGYDRLTNGGVITGWDLTNWATSVLKADTTDMVRVLQANHDINEFMFQELT